MKKRYLLLAITIAIFIIFIWYKNNYSFIPSVKTCGAAINRDEVKIEDSFERGIQCMLAGHKDVYYGNVAGIIYDRIPEQYAKREIQLITLPDGNFVLYTKKGERNAHLFAKQDQDELSRKNHYLTGHLLGYSEEDIKYFYERNKFANYEQDKNEAIKWLQKHSQ